MSLVKMYSSINGEFKIKDVTHETSTESDVEEKTDLMSYDTFEDIIQESNSVDVSESNKMALIYIAGYAANSVVNSLKCENCKNMLCSEHTMTYDSQAPEVHVYLRIIDRGGLKWPSQFTFDVTACTFSVFQCLISETYEEEFLKVKNQRHLIQHLGSETCEYNNIGADYSICGCEVSSGVLVRKIIKVISNILLKNYCLSKQESLASTSGKKRKLQTYAH